MGVRLLKNRAVFLDRDGVINRALVKEGKPYPPKSIDELDITAGASTALYQLKEAGFILIVVTNQPDVGRGKQKEIEVDEIHSYLKSRLPIDAFYSCFHGKDGECNCRKPLPGMLNKAAFEHDIELKRSYMVGDRWKDIDAGKAAGCKTVFIDYSYKERQPLGFDYKTTSLSEAGKIIVRISNS